MSFSLSSSVVTQTGTDTDLSGLASHGATVVDHGAYKVYDMGSNRLVVNGTLEVNTLDGVQEQLLIGTGSQSVVDLEVGSSGSLTVGLEAVTEDGSYVDSRHFPSVVEKDVNLNFSDSRGKNDAWSGSTCPFLLVQEGGHFAWNGTIICCGGIAFDGDSNSGHTDSVIKFNHAIWDSRTVKESSSFDQLIYSYTRDIEINSFTVIALKDFTKAILFGQLATPLYSIKGYEGVFTGAAFSGSTSQPVGFTLIIEDYAGVTGNDSAEDIQPQGRTDTDTGDVTFRNSKKGGALRIGIDQTDSIALIKAEQTIKGNFKTELGEAITDFKIGTVDHNNLLYSSTDLTGGEFNMGNILLAKWVGGQGVATLTKTDYSPSGSGDDTYNFYLYSYLYNPKTRLQVILRKVGGQYIEFIGGLDLGVTEQSRSNALAYSSIANLNQLYDRSKAYKIDNILIPSLDKELIKASGTSLDFGALDINLVSTGSAFSSTATTVTINVTSQKLLPTSKFSIIKSSGTLSIAAGITVNNITFDCDVITESTEDLIGVTFKKDLTYNLASSSTVILQGSAVEGQIGNSAGGNTLTVNLTKGSSATASDPGTGNGETNIQQPVPIKVTVRDIADNSTIDNARVFLAAGAGGNLAQGTIILDELTDANGEVNKVFNYTSDQPVTGRVRKAT